jgi:CubicO group peptidase (beta-lactamase class C family)
LPDDTSDDDAWREIFLKAAKMLNISTDGNQWSVWRAIGDRLPYTNPAGKVMEYNSHAYDLCRKIMVKISGNPIDEIARERLFEPLGMVDSHWILPKEKWDRVMQPGEGTMGYPWQGRDENLISESGGGGIKATSGDMIKFCEMIRCEGIYKGKRVISPMSVRAMCKNYNGHIENEYSAWALGFNYRGNKIDDSGILRPSTAIDHGGYAGAKMQIDKENDLTFTFLNISYNDKPEYNIHSRFINTVYSCLSR